MTARKSETEIPLVFPPHLKLFISIGSASFDQLSEGLWLLQTKRIPHSTQLTGGDRQSAANSVGIKKKRSFHHSCSSFVLCFDLVSFVVCYLSSDKKVVFHTGKITSNQAVLRSSSYNSYRQGYAFTYESTRQKQTEINNKRTNRKKNFDPKLFLSFCS